MLAPPRCWNCSGVELVITSDPAMDGLTDMCICLSCGELQDDEVWEAVATEQNPT